MSAYKTLGSLSLLLEWMHGDAVPDHPQWKVVMERYLAWSVWGHGITSSPPQDIKPIWIMLIALNC